jgi:hypothetical protein
MLLLQVNVSAAGFATPFGCELNDKQCIVIACEGS